MYDPADGPAFRRTASLEAEAAIHPYAAYGLDRTRKSKFVPGVKGKVRDFSDAEFRQVRAIYWGMISEVDSQLGRIWDALAAAGDWDNTVILLMSDHAEMMGDHVSMGKGGFFDQSYHVPLIIRDPRRPASHGAQIEAFTEAVDIMPTVADLIGVAVPPHLDGRSLTPFLDGAAPADWRDAAHWEFDFRSIAKGNAERHFGLTPQQCNLAVIRRDRYKYVHFNGGLPPLLFDMVEDPDETRNVADDPAHLRARLDMAERLLAWRAEHLDQSLALLQLTGDGLVGPR